MRVSLIALALLLPVPVLAAADGSKPAPSPAPHEQKKASKETPDSSAKVYTNEDLKDAGKGEGAVTFLAEPQPGESAPSEPSSPTAGDETGRSPAASADESGSTESRQASSETGVANDEAGWRAHAGEQREAIKNAQNELARLEADLQDLELDRNPNPEDLLDPMRLQKREARKTEARAQMETVRAALAVARQAFEDLEAEARRAGVPHTWLEER